MTKFMQQILFNPECWACGSPLAGARDFCFSCRREILSALRHEGFLLRYEGAVTGLLACLRGSAPRRAAEWCLALLERSGQVSRWREQGFHSVVLAPQNPRREESGLEIVGEKIGEEMGIPVLRPFEKLEKHSQHGRTISGRMDTPCFMKVSGKVSGKLLLIDDVHTTGTTLDQCAYLLRKAGAAEVATFSLARQMMPGFEREKKQASEEGDEMSPFLLHLFV